ncbi:ribonuclease E [Marinobacterium zhoushanense]|uniref:Ribonuclease E n=2 Tax=Marinobacterium zhoushanense TaxID=1679163 RepID=A0ABQ1KPD8_9GAMM|nr:ribonuclease E [Marinobacterium zhoushanense]
MLINATQPEELRVALVDGQRLFDLDIESDSREQKKANIYKGRITRVEPSLEAAFVDYGAERHGFLPLKEISREYFSKQPERGQRPSIKEMVKEGSEVIVQVDKEERGNKGAALTTFISLAGRYLVLMPNNPRAGGISRRIEGDERTQLKEALSGVNIPDQMGAIVRTAGIGRSSEELQWDLDYLITLWDAITATAARPAPFLIYQESNVVIRAIRDYLRSDIGEVLIDDQTVYDQALMFVRQVMPSYENRIKLYKEQIPLFNRFQIETQIETAFEREVKLPSGGSIVIDPTEALVSIDINSARATRGGDIEETALNTNLEAADEIARQLRLRDIGGLIVIDFIDMTPIKHQREVEKRLGDALKLDRARVQMGRISRFGLLEMSRQRLRPSLAESRGHVCPRCNGQGTIRDTESLALSILRLIEEESAKDRTAQIRAILPVSVATFLLNEKRREVHAIELRNGVQIVIVPNPNMETPHYEVVRLRDDHSVSTTHDPSYTLQPETVEEQPEASPAPVKREKAAVEAVIPTARAPQSAEEKAFTEQPQAQDKTPSPAPTPVTLSFGERVVATLGRLFGKKPEEAKPEAKKEREEEKPRTRSTQETRSRGGSGKSRRRSDDRRGGDRRRSRDNDEIITIEQEQALPKIGDKGSDERSDQDKGEGSGRSRRRRRSRRRSDSEATAQSDELNQNVPAEQQEETPAPQEAETQAADTSTEGDEGRSRRRGRRRRKGDERTALRTPVETPESEGAAAEAATELQESGEPMAEQGTQTTETIAAQSDDAAEPKREAEVSAEQEEESAAVETGTQADDSSVPTGKPEEVSAQSEEPQAEEETKPSESDERSVEPEPAIESVVEATALTEETSDTAEQTAAQDAEPTAASEESTGIAEEPAAEVEHEKAPAASAEEVPVATEASSDSAEEAETQETEATEVSEVENEPAAEVAEAESAEAETQSAAEAAQESVEAVAEDESEKADQTQPARRRRSRRAPNDPREVRRRQKQKETEAASSDSESGS